METNYEKYFENAELIYDEAEGEDSTQKQVDNHVEKIYNILKGKDRPKKIKTIMDIFFNLLQRAEVSSGMINTVRKRILKQLDELKTKKGEGEGDSAKPETKPEER